MLGHENIAMPCCSKACSYNLALLPLSCASPPFSQVMQEVLLLAPHGYRRCFGNAKATLSAWAARFLRRSRALTLGLVCSQAHSIHLEYTLLLNRAVLHAARGLESLTLNLPDVLGPSLRRWEAEMLRG